MVNCSAVDCTKRPDTPSKERLRFHKIPSNKKPLTMTEMVT